KKANFEELYLLVKKDYIYENIGDISSDEILSDNNISTNPNSDIENANNKLIAKPNLRKIASWQNHRQKEPIERALVEWIITNLQPLNILQSESFIKLIYALNPYYKLPSNKQIIARIHQAYNYSAERFKALFKEELKTCSLTCDL
ncbi:18984_t:CDS:2, partial [Gigaspora rosea]